MEYEYGVQETLTPDENSGLEQNTENAESSDELKKAQELANNYKIRAEKAEALAKQLKTKPKEESETPKTSDENLSTKDLYALMSEKVPQEDIDEVVKASKILGLSVGESLKSNVVKSLLSTRAEERKTAQATFTGGGRKAPAKISEEDLLNRAISGDIPEDDASIEKLIAAQQKKQIGK